MPVVRLKHISRKTVKAYPDISFVFGDNIHRRGRGGQAKEMRGEPNAIGVATKVKPSMTEGSFLDDTNLSHWNAILADICLVEEKLQKGGFVVLPSDGIGTGLAGLQDHAPLIAAFVEKKFEQLAAQFGAADAAQVFPDI